MKTTELRIGNLIEYKGEILPVSSLHCDDTFRLQKGEESIGCFSACNANGVQLTEEWLLKFGFITKWNDGGRNVLRTEWSIKGMTLFFNTRGSDKKTACIWHDIGFDSSVRIKHVHQLQNLYFALTGEELLTARTE